MVDLVIIGGGPAGLAAACKAWESGLRDILILERDKELGGILNNLYTLNTPQATPKLLIFLFSLHARV